MYEAFYGLNEKPFNLNTDPDYLYMSESHENAFTHLEYAIAENKAFVVVTGEIGSGKTTLIKYLLAKVTEDIHIGLINNTQINHTQLIKLICHQFKLEVENLDYTSRLESFHEFLLNQFALDKRVVLIVDEAQNLPSETLEEIRLLSNLEAEKHHLIQIILLGQPKLKYKLQKRDLQQFAQRVTVNCHLEGLNPNEVKNYIHHRLKVAGAKKPNIFDTQSIQIIAENSRGIPLMINNLCDAALIYGYADDLESIGEDIINDVIKDITAGGIVSSRNKNKRIDSTDRSKTMKSTTSNLNYGNDSPEYLTNQAWAALDDKRFDDAISYAERCVKFYKKYADSQQAELKEYKKGEEAHQYWALNTVGTCLFIAGKCYFYKNDFHIAFRKYSELKDNYFYSQCWNNEGFFWKPSIAAEIEIIKINELEML